MPAILPEERYKITFRETHTTLLHPCWALFLLQEGLTSAHMFRYSTLYETAR
jgi:hypothetical protein